MRIQAFFRRGAETSESARSLSVSSILRKGRKPTIVGNVASPMPRSINYLR